jgi:tetratricopeptide (TPR) repeat protein
VSIAEYLIYWYVGSLMSAPKSTPSPAPSKPTFDWLTAGLVIIGLLQFLSAFAPSVWTWGIDYWSVLPLWARSAFLLLVAVSILPGAAEKIAAGLEHKNWPRWAGWAAAVAALALFIGLRSRGYAYGDGYSFSSYLEGGKFPAIGGQLAFMAGDLVLHWLVYSTVVMPFGGSVETSYAIVSAAAGIATLAAIVAIARKLYPKNRGARWTLIAAGCSSGTAVLWFGHVEAYSLVGAALMWSLACLLLERRGLAWGLWILACALHLLAVAFLPALIWTTWGQKILSPLTKRKTFILFLIGFLGWGLAGVVFSLVKPGIFVPLLRTQDSTYTAFSVAHLSDAINLLFFAAPLGLIGIAAWLFSSTQNRNVTREDEVLSILLVASASLWYFSFWVDPLIGAFRDWDLIGAFGIPLSILGAVILLRNGRDQGQWVTGSVLAIVHTLAFVFTVQTETAAIDRIERLVRQDVHYTRDFHRGERLMSWSFILTHVVDRKELAAAHLFKRTQWEPGDVKSWANLGSLHWQMGQYDSSSIFFEEALKLDPDDPKTLEQLAFAYSGAKNWERAAETVEKLAGMRELKLAEINLWAFAALTLQRDALADSLISASLRLNPDQQEGHYYRGIAKERQADTAAALESYERAMAPQSDVEDVYLRSARLYQAMARWGDAERVSAMWQQRFPNSPTAAFFTGVNRIATGQYETGKTALERSLQLNPNNALGLFYLATAYRNLGEMDKAGQAARRASELDANLALPYLELVYLAADAGDRAAAVAATREYLKRAPYDSGMTYLQQFMEP